MKKKLKLKDVLNEHGRALGGGIAFPRALGEDFGGEETERVAPDRRGLDFTGGEEKFGRREGDQGGLSNLVRKTKLAADQAEKLLGTGDETKAHALLKRLHDLLMKKLG